MTALHRYTLLVVVALLAALLGGCADIKVTSRATGEILETRG